MRKYLVEFLGLFKESKELRNCNTFLRRQEIKEANENAIEEYKQKNAPLGAFTALEVQQWLKSPITKKMVRVFENLRLGISNGVAQGRCNNDTLPVMIGKCQGIEEIIHIMSDVQGEGRKEHTEEVLSLYLFNIFNEEK